MSCDTISCLFASDVAFVDLGTNEVGFARLQTVSGSIVVSGNSVLSAVTAPSLEGHIASITVTGNKQLKTVQLGSTKSFSTGNFLLDSNRLLSHISSSVLKVDTLSVVFGDQQLKVDLPELQEAKSLKLATTQEGTLGNLSVSSLKNVGSIELSGFFTADVNSLEIPVVSLDGDIVFEGLYCSSKYVFSFPYLVTAGSVKLINTFTGTYGGRLSFPQLKKLSGSFVASSSNVQGMDLPLLEVIDEDWKWSNVRSSSDVALNLVVPSLNTIGGVLSVNNLFSGYQGPSIRLELPKLSSVGGSVKFTNTVSDNLKVVNLAALSSVCSNADANGALVFTPTVDFVMCPDLIDAHNCTIPTIQNVTFPHRCSSA